MTNENILKHLGKLKQIAYSKKLINFEGATSNDYSYKWLLNNDSSYVCDYTIPVESLDNAIEIVRLFSQEPKDLIRLGLQSQTFNNESQIYLHFTKDIKLPQ
ncbi:hypothetical protein [Epilithonimonas hungarica]|uniref:Uncharacterized protein n=1 Tax=Epilithonimonas hungarica TaxID=454006 RepID=A0A1G7LN02_9FLAO|nr:hypothetical protein [Epilithonimonas hungarica]SDF50875.1 hypothetical protein SAMN05421825_1550 [Epilithonimonas hungarica]